MDTTISSTTVDDVEQPDVLARNIRVGSRIWAASQAFFFLAFFFAFLYLRALNTNGLWRGWPHHHPSPSMAFGVAILICVLGSAAIARSAVLVAPQRWRTTEWAALALALAAVGLQCAQFSSLGFGPTDAAYASVFVGWRDGSRIVACSHRGLPRSCSSRLPRCSQRRSFTRSPRPPPSPPHSSPRRRRSGVKPLRVQRGATTSR